MALKAELETVKAMNSDQALSFEGYIQNIEEEKQDYINHMNVIINENKQLTLNVNILVQENEQFKMLVDRLEPLECQMQDIQEETHEKDN
jgi:uncharacterized protein (UPF0335 family)